MQTLKRVGVWSLAKFGCVFGLLVYGFIFSVLAALASPVIAAIGKGKPEALLSVAPLCGLIIVGAAISGAIGGFVHFAIMGVIVNLVLMITGGIELDMAGEPELIPEPEPFLKVHRYSSESGGEIRPIANRR